VPKRHHPTDARIQLLCDAFDDPALAGRIAPLEQNHHSEPFVPDPFLKLDQLDLKPGKLSLVDLLLDLAGVLLLRLDEPRRTCISRAISLMGLCRIHETSFTAMPDGLGHRTGGGQAVRLWLSVGQMNHRLDRQGRCRYLRFGRNASGRRSSALSLEAGTWTDRKSIVAHF
jgi:hypothetical protein